MESVVIYPGCIFFSSSLLPSTLLGVQAKVQKGRSIVVQFFLDLMAKISGTFHLSPSPSLLLKSTKELCRKMSEREREREKIKSRAIIQGDLARWESSSSPHPKTYFTQQLVRKREREIQKDWVWMTINDYCCFLFFRYSIGWIEFQLGDILLWSYWSIIRVVFSPSSV